MNRYHGRVRLRRTGLYSARFPRFTEPAAQSRPSVTIPSVIRSVQSSWFFTTPAEMRGREGARFLHERAERQMSGCGLSGNLVLNQSITESDPEQTTKSALSWFALEPLVILFGHPHQMSRQLSQSTRYCSLLIGATLALALCHCAAAQSNQPARSFKFSHEDDVLELTIADARADDDGVWVELSPKAAKDFGAFTQRHIGEVVDIVVDGQILSSPKIRTSILGGQMRLIGQGHIDFETMAVRLKTGDAKLIVRVKGLPPH